MKAKRLMVCTIMVLAGCRTMPAGEVETQLELLEEAIQERAQSFNEALRTGNPNLIVSSFESEAYYLLPDTVNLRKQDLLQYFTNYLQLKPTIRTVTEHISLAQELDMAWEVGWFSQEYDTPEGGRILSHSRYVTIWEKTGGAWYIGAHALIPSGVLPHAVLPPVVEVVDSLAHGLPPYSTAVILPRAELPGG